MASRFDWVNELTERVLAATAKSGRSGVIALETGGRRVLATRIQSTGWLLIMAVL